MIFIFGFLDKFFHKEKSGDQPQEPEKSFRSIELSSDELIWAQMGGEVPKVWKGIINSVNENIFKAEIPGLFREAVFPFNEGDEVLLSVNKKDRVGRFKSKIIKIDSDSKPPILMLEYPREVIWKELIKRKHKRMRMDVPAKVKDENQKAQWIMGRVYNMGMGGLCFRSPEPLRKGDDAKVKLMSLEFSQEMRGTVIWTSQIHEEGLQGNLKYNIGIKFYELDDMSKKVIADFAWKMRNRTSANIEQSGFLLRGE